MSVLINTHKWSIVALLVTALSACGGADTSDLVDFVESAHRDSKPEIDPLPEIRLYENFVYSATDLPDPFETLNLLPGSDGAAAGGVSPDTNRRKEPLENFALGDLSLVGTMQRNDQPWVIIKAPDGTVHRITTGNYAGKNYGRVVGILDSRVDLMELVLGTGNRWVERGAFLAFGAAGSQEE